MTSDNDMKASEELREKMWELCYDLLPDDERRALVATIKSDPQAARLYAEVRLQADLVGFAAKVEDSSLILSADLEKVKTSDAIPAGGRRKEAAQPATFPLASASPTSGGRNWVRWLPAAAALALVALMAYGVYRPTTSGDPLIAGIVSTEIEIPSRLKEGLSTRFVVRSQSPQGQPIAADVDVKFVDEAGAVRYQEVIRTDATGVATLTAPGPALVRGVRVEAISRRESQTDGLSPEQQVAAQLETINQITAPLNVAQQAPLTYYLQEKPAAKPGESTRFAIYSLSRFGLEARPAEVKDLVVQNAEGVPVAEPLWTWNEDFVEGSIPFPDKQEADKYNLAFRSKAAFDQKFGGEADRKSERQLALLQMERRDERPAMRSRFSASGAKAPATAAKQAEGDSNQSRDASLEKSKEAVAQSVEDISAADAAALPAQQAAAPVLEAGAPVTLSVPQEAALSKKMRVEAYARGVQVLSQQLEQEFKQPAGPEGDLKNLAAKDATTKDAIEELAEREIAVNLPPEADGLVRVKLVDASKSPPEVVREHTVYRRPARELKVALVETKNEFQPGENVRLQVQVLDERDRPASATLAVRTWNIADIEASGQEPVMLADVVHSYSDVDVAEATMNLAHFGKSLSELDLLARDEQREAAGELKKYDSSPAAAGTAPAAPAATAPAPQAPAPPAPAEPRKEQPAGDRAADGRDQATVQTIRAGGASPDPLAESPSPSQPEPHAVEGLYEAEAYEVVRPLVITNEARIQQKYRSLTTQREQAWQAWRAMVGRVLVIGGVAALAGILGLFLMRTPVRAASGTLTLLAATASLIVGAFWISGHQRQTVEIAAALPPAAERKVNEFAADGEGFAQLNDNGDRAAGGYMPGHDVRLKSEAAPEELAKFGEAAAGAESIAPTLAPADAPAPAPATIAGPEDAKPGSGEGAFGTLAAPAAAEGDKAAAKGGGRAMAPGGLGGGKPEAAADLTRGEEDKAGVERADRAPAGASSGRPLPSVRRAQGAATPAPSGGPGRQDGLEKAEVKSTDKLAAANPDADLDENRATRGDLSNRPALEPEPKDGAKQAGERLNRGLGNEAAAPASLYFNPRMLTDAEGYVTIEFQMPAVESEYRVLIDAFGQGRVGSAEVTIMCRK